MKNKRQRRQATIMYVLADRIEEQAETIDMLSRANAVLRETNAKLRDKLKNLINEQKEKAKG